MASQRSGALPSVEAHEAKMTAMRQARLGGMKANSELEQQVYHLQGELERLQQELKDEESEAVDALELDSEVCVALLPLSLALEVHHRQQQVLTTYTLVCRLRIKLYRDMGFLPIEENGVFSKVVVRASLLLSPLSLDQPLEPDG